MLPTYQGHALICVCKSMKERDETVVSPEKQLDACVQTCAIRGWSYEVLHDVEAWRGDREDNRRSIWLDARERLASSEVSAVVVYRLDPMSRSPEDIFSLMADCGQGSVVFMSATSAPSPT